MFIKSKALKQIPNVKIILHSFNKIYSFPIAKETSTMKEFQFDD